MSRYFDLMRANEADQAVQARERGEAVSPTLRPSSAEDSFESGLQWTGSSQSLAITPRPLWPQPEPARVSFLRFLVEACFRHPRSFLGIAAAGMLVTALAILTTPKRYQATMQMAVLHTGQYAVGGSDPVDRAVAGDANAQVELLRSRDLLSQALDLIGSPAPTALARDEAIDALVRNLEVAPVAGAPLLRLSYRDSSPQTATDVLQAVATSFMSQEAARLRPPRRQALTEVVEQKQRELAAAQQDVVSFQGTTGIAYAGPTESAAADPWQDRVAAAQKNLDSATQKRNQAVVDDAVDKERIRSAVMAAKPSASSIPVGPRPVVYWASGFAGALFLAVSFCAFAERRRTTVYSPMELEALTGVTTLGTVPRQRAEAQK